MATDLKAALEIVIRSVGADKLQKLSVALDKVNGHVKKLDVVLKKVGSPQQVQKAALQMQKLQAQAQLAQGKVAKLNAQIQKEDVLTRKVAYSIAASAAARADASAKAIAQQRLLNAQTDKAVAAAAKLRAQTDKLRSAEERRVRAASQPSLARRAGRGLMAGLGMGEKAVALGFGAYYAGQAAAGGIEALFGPSVQFESIMAQVKTKGALTDAQTAKLKAAAIKMGETSIFKPTEAAETFASQAAAGLTPEQIIKNMPVIKKFAIASGMGAEEASAGLINAANMFGMDLNDPNTLNRVGNAIFKAGRKSTISEADIFETLKYAGPPGALQGYQIEDVVAWASAIGMSGVKSSQAGTGLRNMLISMVKPKGGKLTRAMLKELGLNEDDVMRAADEQRMPSFLAEMDARADRQHWTRGKKLKLSAAMFGQYGMTAENVLAAAASGKTKAGDGSMIGLLADIAQSVRSSADELERGYQTKLQTPEARIEAAKARMESLLIQFGEHFMPKVISALDLMVLRLDQLIELQTFWFDKSTKEQIGRAGDARDIPVYGPGMGQGQTAGSRSNWFPELDSLPKNVWKEGFANPFKDGIFGGQSTTQSSVVEVRVKAENGTSAKIERINKGKTPLRAATSVSP